MLEDADIDVKRVLKLLNIRTGGSKFFIGRIGNYILIRINLLFGCDLFISSVEYKEQS
jgi:hypothetical protein